MTIVDYMSRLTQMHAEIQAENEWQTTIGKQHE
jgi:hypothetical protein